MTHSENFALNQWLSDYPEDMPYADILACLRDPENTWTCDDISVWVAVENFTLDQVAEFIEDTRTAFENTVKHMQQVKS
jgi:hypothetical protein